LLSRRKAVKSAINPPLAGSSAAAANRRAFSSVSEDNGAVGLELAGGPAVGLAAERCGEDRGELMMENLSSGAIAT
jgi:hypothetical protein